MSFFLQIVWMFMILSKRLADTSTLHHFRKSHLEAYFGTFFVKWTPSWSSYSQKLHKDKGNRCNLIQCQISGKFCWDSQISSQIKLLCSESLNTRKQTFFEREHRKNSHTSTRINYYHLLFLRDANKITGKWSVKQILSLVNLIRVLIKDE